MAGLQRFITYIYKYENDEKKQNAGFAKVEVRGSTCRMEVHVRNINMERPDSIIYLFARKEKIMQSVPVGNMNIQRGNGDIRYSFEVKELLNFGLSMDRMEGIFIPLGKEGYLASQWKEGEIREGHFQILKKQDEKNSLQEEETKQESQNPPSVSQEQEQAPEQSETRQQIPGQMTSQRRGQRQILSYEQARNQTSYGQTRNQAIPQRQMRNPAMPQNQTKEAGLSEEQSQSRTLTQGQSENPTISQDRTLTRDQAQRSPMPRETVSPQEQSEKQEEPQNQTPDQTTIQEQTPSQESARGQVSSQERTQNSMTQQQERPQQRVQSQLREQLLFELQRRVQEQAFSPRNSSSEGTMGENVQATELPMEKFFEESGWEGIFQKKKLKLPVFFPFEDEDIECVKMDLTDLRQFPKKYWHLGNNSFLLHGYFNYKHILMGEMIEDGKKEYFVGVPGIFQNQERIMAMMFGFPEFRTSKTAEHKTGNFGYWYRII